MNVPKTAMAPKPATTSTVTRGGFGDSGRQAVNNAAQLGEFPLHHAPDGRLSDGKNQHYRSARTGVKSDRIWF